MKNARDSRISVVVLGGSATALSIVRSLGRVGIPSYAINYPQAEVRYSRFANGSTYPRRGS